MKQNKAKQNKGNPGKDKVGRNKNNYFFSMRVLTISWYIPNPSPSIGGNGWSPGLSLQFKAGWAQGVAVLMVLVRTDPMA